MKLTAILLLAACLQITARTAGQTVTLKVKNVPMKEVFREIQKQTGLDVLVDEALLQKTGKVTLDVKDMPVPEVLNICLKNEPLSYTIVDGRIVVKPKQTEVFKPVDITPKTETTNVILPIDITGKVTDKDGNPLAGANVKVKGTSIGTTTDKNGEFTLKSVDENSVLEISFVGYEMQTIVVRNKTVINASLSIAVKGLDETIIKGYYTTSKRLNTGNVSKVTAEEIGKQPISNPLAALEGRMPGVYIQQTTGVPGGAFNIQIRGQNSLRNSLNNSASDNGNLPLYVIDGVPFTPTSLGAGISGALQTISPLNSFNPADIESIEILKDADATAIYGARGANGVVLITTKKGKAGKTKVDVNLYTGWGKVSQRMDLLNTQQYLEMRIEALKNDGLWPLSPSLYNAVPDVFRWDTTRYTDWQKVFLGGTAHITNAQASISGGNLNTQFLVGSGYYNETTVFPGDFGDSKTSVHFTLNHLSENKKFQSSLSANYISESNRLPGQDFTTRAVTLAPDAPQIYDQTGKLNWQNGTWLNPFQSIIRKYKGITDNLIAQASLSYKILPQLQIKSNFGYTKMSLNEIQTNPISANNPANVSTGSTSFANGYNKTWIIEPQVEYQKFIRNGKLTAQIGTTFQEDIREKQWLVGSGYTSDALLENPKAAPSVSLINFNYTQYRYSAIFGRLNYDWKQKYLINLTARRDGSSRFGADKRFGNFGAVGCAWIFSEENFIKKVFRFISYGKLRSSFGITGSDQIADYGFMDTYSSTTYSYQGAGLYPTQLVNPDYSWETNKKFEAALELGILKDRFLLNISWYRNRSGNQLVGYNLPNITGFSSVQFNLPAVVQNTGFEFEITSKNIKSKNLNWTTNLNVTIPRNKLISYPNIEGSSYASTYTIGEPLGSFKGYYYGGVDPQTGKYVFIHLTDHTLTSSPSFPADRKNVIKATQSLYGGLQNIISYKGLQIDIFFQFVKQTGRNYLQAFNQPGSNSNQPVYVMNRWQKPGDKTDIQRFSLIGTANAAYNFYRGSNRVISDFSFIRFKNLSISYQLLPKWIEKLKIQACKIYLQGQNLFTITNYLGLDPENQTGVLLLPPLRVIAAGIQFTF
jgi:TonB-linked SusC/RagA family outer membrane protein